MVAGVVFARRGSHWSGKYTAPICGYPAVAFGLAAGLQCADVDKLWLSTNCPVCTATAYEMGVPVIHRPPELCTDESPPHDRWCHAIDHIRAEGYDPATFVHIGGASPVRERGLLSEALRIHKETGLPYQTTKRRSIECSRWELIAETEGIVACPPSFRERSDHNTYDPAIYPSDSLLVFDCREGYDRMKAHVGIGERLCTAPADYLIDCHNEDEVAMAEGLLARFRERFVHP